MIHLHLSRLLYLLRFDGIDGTKEIPMWIYTHKALTQRKEASQESDGIGNDMVELRPGKSEEIKQEGMRRKRKPSIHMRKKKNPLIVSRVRLDLTWSRKPTAMARNQPFILILADVVHRDNSGQPLPRGHDAEEM